MLLQVNTWIEMATCHLRAISDMAPGSTFVACQSDAFGCMEHSFFKLRNVFEPFRRFIEKKLPGFLIQNPSEDWLSLPLYKGEQLISFYQTNFINQYNCWLRNRFERLGESMSLPFEELTQDEYEILTLSDIDFAREYEVMPPRKWTWAQTVESARQGLYEPRPLPTLKCGRSDLLNQEIGAGTAKAVPKGPDRPFSIQK